MSKLSTIYIISKGRPQCKTAETLTKMNYPGEWFIVNGNNDETHKEYIKNWGKDKVLLFDWYEEVNHSDLLDNFGVEIMGSGAVPVRNATRRISEERGELRHWQFDDDYNNFYKYSIQNQKWESFLNYPERFERELKKIAEFAYKTGMSNIGFLPASDTRPDTIKLYRKRVFNAHNMPTDPKLFMKSLLKVTQRNNGVKNVQNCHLR